VSYLANFRGELTHYYNFKESLQASWHTSWHCQLWTKFLPKFSSCLGTNAITPIIVFPSQTSRSVPKEIKKAASMSVRALTGSCLRKMEEVAGRSQRTFLWWDRKRVIEGGLCCSTSWLAEAERLVEAFCWKAHLILIYIRSGHRKMGNIR